MTNYVLGTVTILVCVLGYVLAFQSFRKGHDFPAILLIVLCGFLLRLFTGVDLYLHEWDERYHALVAKNLINHPLLPTLYDHPLLPYDLIIETGLRITSGYTNSLFPSGQWHSA